MAKIIVTSRYFKNPSQPNVGKLLRYMATREGVEKVSVGVDHAPASVRQKRLIQKLLKAEPDVENDLEYRDYLQEPCKSNATAFLNAFAKRNADRAEDIAGLVSYMAQRPSVEKIGSHVLFSQSDEKIDLDQVAEEVTNHKGTVWTHVISLHREDAERLGYNNANAWRDLVRCNAIPIAEAHKYRPKRTATSSLFLLELCTGMRRGEITALQWEDLNMQTGTLRISRQATTVRGQIYLSAPKTRSSIRTAILPPDIVKLLAEYKKNVNSRWIFPSPVKADAPRHPAAVRKILGRLLERAECKHIRFHDLRHTFATTALANGMDVKTLSAMIGHISAKTTLNIYTHTTDTMQRSAANKMERGFGRNEGSLREVEQIPAPTVKSAQRGAFEPKQPKHRRPGTGCISELSNHLFEGRYSPTNAYGKCISKNVYARTKEECEEKLAALIAQMKAEIAEEKKRLKAGESAL